MQCVTHILKINTISSKQPFYGPCTPHLTTSKLARHHRKMFPLYIWTSWIVLGPGRKYAAILNSCRHTPSHIVNMKMHRCRSARVMRSHGSRLAYVTFMSLFSKGVSHEEFHTWYPTQGWDMEYAKTNLQPNNYKLVQKCSGDSVDFIYWVCF